MPVTFAGIVCRIVHRLSSKCRRAVSTMKKIGIFADIKIRKQTDFMTALSENILQLETGAPAGFGQGEACCAATFLMDEGGRLQAFDAEAQRLFHCRAEDALGQGIWTLLPDFPRALLRPGDAAPTSRNFAAECLPQRRFRASGRNDPDPNVHGRGEGLDGSALRSPPASAGRRGFAAV